MPDFLLEDLVLSRTEGDVFFVAGVDEVGMGALAGPIVAAANNYTGPLCHGLWP